MGKMGILRVLKHIFNPLNSKLVASFAFIPFYYSAANIDSVAIWVLWVLRRLFLNQFNSGKKHTSTTESLMLHKNSLIYKECTIMLLTSVLTWELTMHCHKVASLCFNNKSSIIFFIPLYWPKHLYTFILFNKVQNVIAFSSLSRSNCCFFNIYQLCILYIDRLTALESTKDSMNLDL